MRDRPVPTRCMTSLMRGPLGALPQRSAFVVVIGLLLALAAARGAFANTPPIADAGPDQTVCLGEPVMLMGYAEDPDGDPIACWDWAIDWAPEGSLADLPDFMLPDPLFRPDLPGDYLLSLVVTDGLNCSLPDSVAIYVTEDPPPAEATTMQAMAASDLAYPEEITEVYRSPFGTAFSVAVNPTDGSCWAATGGSVMHLAPDGTILSQTDGFCHPASVSVNRSDGSCWVADYLNHEVVHLREDGSELWRGPFAWARCVSVNPTDGSCWVADASRVTHLSEAGGELSREGGFVFPLSVCVNPTDGSCWVADTGHNQVVHLTAEGTRLSYGDFYRPHSVSVNQTDNSCWVADTYNDQVVHLAEDGEVLGSTSGLRGARAVSVNPNDGSCWVAAIYDSVVHLAENGAVLWAQGGTYCPMDLSVDPEDGSCWVGHRWPVPAVVHLREDGTELWRGAGFGSPNYVAVNPTDASCRVADGVNNQVVHLAEDGTELWRHGGFFYPGSVSVDPTDGSCWIADGGHHQVVHLAEDGTELWRSASPAFWGPKSLCVNPGDGSCWVADTSNNQVVHLAPNGDELWRGSGFCHPRAVSVNPTDGSCWVADSEHHEVVRLAEDGTEVFRLGGYLYPESVAVNPTDGSCWVADRREIVHVDENGAVLWRGDGFGYVLSLSVNATDGSCWVPCRQKHEVVHLAADGAELSRVRGFFTPYAVSVNPADGSCWVTDGGHSQVVHLVAVPFDSTPPVTVYSLTADLGDNGWYVSSVTVSLTATDEEGGSGVKEIHYAATGAQPIAETVVPGDSATLTITAEGATELSFWAVDNAGNVEAANTLTLKVDTTAPTLTPPPDVEVEEGDPFGTPAVDLGQPTVSDTCDPNPTVANDAPALFPLGVTTVTWTATDAAGNVATAEQTVTVVPGSPDNQLDNLRKFILARVASAHIASEMEESLLAKVDAAIAALARGDPPGVKVVMNDLKALVNQVEAQTDKKIDPATAAEIIERANRIIAALGG